MSDINIHFSREEFAERQRRTRERMAELELDGLLLFKFEDMYWLSGYDSDGFTIFGCMFLGTNGALTHLARPADLGNASYSSICEDVRIAPDAESEPRSGQIKAMLESLGMQGKRIGIQVDTMGLTPRLFLQIQTGTSWLVRTDRSTGFHPSVAPGKKPAGTELYAQGRRNHG